MNRAVICAPWYSALLLAGCTTPSLHPLVSPQVQIEEPALVGDWAPEGEEDGAIMKVSALQPSRDYQVAFHPPPDEDDEPITLNARVVALGRHRFLDVILDPASIEDRRPLVLPAHVFVRIEIAGDRLKCWSMAEDWTKDENLARAAGVERVAESGASREFVIMTAPTAELQRFVSAHAEDERVFNKEPEVYVRRAHGNAE